MSSPEVPQADLDRLIRISAPDNVSVRQDAELRLGSALWEVIDLERQANTLQRPNELDWFDTISSYEAQIGPRVTAEVLFKARHEYVELDKEDWLLRSCEADLWLNTFPRDLPHSDDEISRSIVTLTPKVPVLDDRPGAYRTAPYVLTTEAPERAPLPVPEIETTIRILDKIAGEYAGTT